MRSPGILKLIAALIAGALTVLSFGPFNLYWMGIAGPAVLFHLWRGVPPRGAFLSLEITGLLRPVCSVSAFPGPTSA